MKNSWLTWTLIVGVVVVVLIAFNHQNRNQNVPLTEIFPEEKENPSNVEYEFVNKEQASSAPAKAAPKPAVVAKPVTPAPTAPSPAVAPAPTSSSTAPIVKTNNLSYRIQVASTQDKKKADEMVSKLKAKNMDAKIVEKNLGDKGIWYRIYIGQYATKKEAEDFAQTIKADFPNSLVISTR